MGLCMTVIMRSKNSVLFITIDSCRYDTFKWAYKKGLLKNIRGVGQLYKAYSPSYFTYGSHASFWMGFLPGVIGSKESILNPKAGKLFRMNHTPAVKNEETKNFVLDGENIIDGFNRRGYVTIGTGAVEWFNDKTKTGRQLSKDFKHYMFAGNTFSLEKQLCWIDSKLKEISEEQEVFTFINVGETHVPYWHNGANWEKWPSPCIPFGGEKCSAKMSKLRQRKCIEWIDTKLEKLILSFMNSTIVICADHGDCWGEDGIWDHGISHKYTLEVPLVMRIKGSELKKSETRPRKLYDMLTKIKKRD